MILVTQIFHISGMMLALAGLAIEMVDNWEDSRTINLSDGCGLTTMPKVNNGTKLRKRFLSLTMK